MILRPRIPDFIPEGALDEVNAKRGDEFKYSRDRLLQAKAAALQMESEPHGVLLVALMHYKLIALPDYRRRAIPQGEDREAMFSNGARSVGELGEQPGFGVPALVDAALALRDWEAAERV
jgi:hypothetical protein